MRNDTLQEIFTFYFRKSNHLKQIGYFLELRKISDIY